MKKLVLAIATIVAMGSVSSAEVMGTLSRAGVPNDLVIEDAMNMPNYKAALLAQVLDKDFKTEGSSIKFYDSVALMQLALNKGDIDVFTVPDFVGEYMLRVNPDYILRGF